MNKETAAIRSAQWRRIVDDCINREPGVSKRQWCQDNNIKFRSLMYWQRKFQLEAINQMSTTRIALPTPAAPADAPVFVDVTTQVGSAQKVSDSLPQEQEPISPAPELMIQAGGYRIYVNRSVREATLEKVIKVLAHA